MIPHLEDWEIVVDRQGDEKLAFGMTDNPFQDTEATTFGFAWTNAAHGGCGKATVNLMSQSASFLAGLDLLPDDRLLIRLQCGDESALKDRYVGVIRRVDLGYGTEPKIRGLEANGIIGQFRHIPLFLFMDNMSVAAITTALIADVATKSDITSYSSYITYGTEYTVAYTDFFNQYADRALKRLVELAGPDCVWGVVPGDSGTPTDARFYFQQLGDTAEDLGFEVNVNVQEAKGAMTRDRILNGMLVSCQRQIGGGDLWMFIPPASGTIPYRVGLERVHELVAPLDAYAWAEAKLASFPATDEKITFKVPNFGEQIWANEIIATPLAIALVEGGANYEIMCRSYTTTVDGSGSVDTAFELGTLPKMGLPEQFGDLYRDTIVAKAREFWSSVELAARDSDVIREWRRAAAKNHSIMNFWGTNLDNIESILKPGAWNDGGFEEPSTFPKYGWDYDSEKQRAVGHDSNGTIAVVAIPTGLTAGAAIVYLKTGGASYSQSDYGEFHFNEHTEPDEYWYWTSDWWGLHPKLVGQPTNAWRMAVTLKHKFGTGVPESPMKVWLGPPENLDEDYFTVNTYGDMKALDHYCDIIFGATTTDPTTAAGYCLRVFRGENEPWGNVLVALGWVSGGTFHSNWWDAGATPDVTSAHSIPLGTDGTGGDTHTWELDVWLPTTGGSGEFRVRARKNRTAEVLWDSADFFGDGEVSGSAPTPVGNYYVMCAYYQCTGAESNDYVMGLRNVDTQSPGGIEIAVTRDGEYWTIGNPETLLTLLGDTYLAGERQLMFAVKLGEGNSLSSWAIGFTHETPEINLAWDQNFGDEGTGDGLFKQPIDCTVDAGFIYVSDYNNHRIQLLTNTSPPVYSAKFGTEGTGDANFDHPHGIDDDASYLYIVDSSNTRIKIHAKTSPFGLVRQIALGATAQGITVSGRTYVATDHIYVSCNDGYVWIYQKDGTYVDKFEPFPDHTPPYNVPKDVTVSGDEEHLYVLCAGGTETDDPTNRIIKVKRASPYARVWSWGQRGLDPPNGKWEGPSAVCRLGDVLIVSSGANAVYVEKNYLTTLADRGTYAEYMDHLTGAGGESAGGFLQVIAGDIRDNLLYCAETGYCQVKRFVLS